MVHHLPLAVDSVRRADVTDAQWNDWRWQLGHMLTNADDLARAVSLSPEERAGLAASASLFRVEGRWTVFVVVDRELTQRDVEVGERNDDVAEVVRGLQEGDRVVVYPGESLVTGTRVLVR